MASKLRCITAMGEKTSVPNIQLATSMEPGFSLVKRGDILFDTRTEEIQFLHRLSSLAMSSFCCLSLTFLLFAKQRNDGIEICTW
ncbi:hypothetical protein CEXT_353091 [Caerostris extrusa]|uniref:Uncharacterized protein n=1 Tax=Caerostris extrusa TaxID=172846 RepID=A0AAV4Q2U3_CAEEX|nr:hypothetical protein CEXT_353091 [Caerostris extrusa]